MDDFFTSIPGEFCNTGNDLQTAIVGSAYRDDGCTLIFPGQDEASEKRYKCIRSVPLRKNDRVVVAKMSGTYVILGKLGTPAPIYNMNKCPIDSSATAANCANWINTLMEALALFGIISKNNW